MREIDNSTASLTISKLMTATPTTSTRTTLTACSNSSRTTFRSITAISASTREKKRSENTSPGFFSGEAGILDTLHLMLNLEGIGATWLVGYYTAEFTKEGDEQLISDLVYDTKYFSSYDEGWTEEPMAM